MQKNSKNGLAMTPETDTKGGHKASPASPQTDAQIKSAFEKSYVYKMFLKDYSIKTDVKVGFVTLTGAVEGQFRKDLAQATIANLPGVIRVDNQLLIETEPDTQSADYWIGKKITLTLLFHRNVNASATTVEVKDGVVTLKGVATSKAQQDLTVEYAKDIEGVKEVVMEMTLAPTPEGQPRTLGEKIDDASVTAQVKMALLAHRSTSAVSTKVQTRNGEVTISGNARNEAEISLVTKLVTDIQGVITVKNKMAIPEAKTR